MNDSTVSRQHGPQQEVIEGYRLSQQQRRLWRLQQDGGVYRAQCAIRVTGALDREVFRGALERVAGRHEILHTAFPLLPDLDVPLQVISEEPRFSYTELDRKGVAPGARAAELERIFGEGLVAAFDFQHGPLLRFTLIEWSDEERVLLVSLPALCADARSLGNLFEECARAYAAALARAEEPEEPLQYVQFSEWQQELLETEEAEAGREFWERQRMAELPAVSLPFAAALSKARARVAPRHRGVTAALEFGPERWRRVQALADDYRISVPALLLTCWQTLLWKLTGQTEVVVETLFDGRKFEELHGTLGLLSRYLPVPARLAEHLQLGETLRRVEGVLGEAANWQEYFVREELAGAPAAGDDGAPRPIGFDFQERPAAVGAGGALFELTQQFVRTEPFTLRLSCTRLTDSLLAEFYYDPAVYRPESVESIRDEFDTLLADVLENPRRALGEIEILSDDAKRLLLEGWNDTRVADVPATCVHLLFEAQAARTPEAAAVADDKESLSFAELNRRANRLARYLRRRGVGPESRVGVSLEREVGMVVALLGVMKAGGAYVPLDHGQPKPRLDFLIRDSGIVLLLTRQSLMEALPEMTVPALCLDAEAEAVGLEEATDLHVPVTPGSLAYVIYTSGSTGQPKGTMIEHRSVVNLAEALRRAVYSRHTSPLRVGLNAPLAFDASVKQLVQLLSGHAIHIVPEEGRRDGAALVSFVERHALDVLDCTPTHLRLLRAAGLGERADVTPELVLVGGEALDEATWEALASNPLAEFYNLYGPTECTVNVTVCSLRDNPDAPTLGRPIANVRAYVLDAALRPVPAGVEGELYVGGAGVARGYLRRPAMTAERFLPDPFGGEPGARLYRTGDLACHLPDGRLKFLGRRDGQVKVRGFRVELGEIEAALGRHPSVAEAVVLSRADDAGEPRLVAYLVPKLGATQAGYALPNGMSIRHQNKNETDYLYEEIFEKRVYLQHGVGLSEGACVFDVGANIGMFSLFVSRHCKDAQVYAFEPLAPLFDTLRANAEAYVKNVKLFNVGLSDAEKTETFTLYPRYSMMSGLSAYVRPQDEVEVIKRFMRNEEQAGDAEASLLLEHADELLAGRFEGESHQCRLRTLSALIRENEVERIDLLKIDVQRAELDVLRGIDDDDWGKIQQIVMELHDAEGQESEGRRGQVRSLLVGRGYDVVIEQDDLLEGTGRYNLYAVRRERKSLPPPKPAQAEAGVHPSAADAPAALTAGELRRYLQERLPEYMIPSAFVLLKSLPYNRNGKLDRVALPSPDASRPELERDFVAPQTPEERLLAEVWSQVLGLEQVGVNDGFFDLGGDSIRSLQVQALAQKRGLSLTLQDILRHQTIHELARELMARGDRGGGERRQSRPFELISEEDRLKLPEGVEDAYPLSLLQSGMLYHSELDSVALMYYNANTLHLKAPFDADRMRAAVRQLMRRHAVLRTSFDLHTYSVALQLVHREVEEPLVIEDLRHLPPAEQEEIVGGLIEAEKRTPFDWNRPPLIRFKIHLRSEETFQFTWCEHHAILDGWSLASLTTEFFQLYFSMLEGQHPVQEPPSVEYRDFIALERDALASEENRDFWLGKLQEAPRTDLPRRATPRPAPGGQRTRIHTVPVPVEVSEGLKALARLAGVPLKSVLLAAHLRALSVLSGSTDVVTGLVANGRPERADGDRVLGLFLNTLPLRLALSGGTWLDLVRETFRAEQETLPYRRYPMAQIQKDLGVRSLFETMFNFTHFHILHDLQQLTEAQVLNWETAVVEINLTLTANFELDPLNAHVQLFFQYDAEQLSEEQMQAIGGYYARALNLMTQDPAGKYHYASLLSDGERARLVRAGRGAAVDFPLDLPLHRLFEAQARRTPSAPALRFGGAELSYAALDARASRLASRLLALPLPPEPLVGVCLHRSPELVVALLAALKAGGAYLPLDPDYPRPRLELMLADAAPAALLTSAALGTGPAAPPHTRLLYVEDDGAAGGAAPGVEVSPESLAYVIYTSGSTGTPKGAMNTHRAVSNRLLWMQAEYGLTPADRVMQKTPFTFDVSVWEFFWPLLTGACLVLAEPGGHRDPAYLAELLERERVTTLHFVPSMLEPFLAEPGATRCRQLRRVVCSGEALSDGLRERFRGRLPGVELYNLYGPTEAAVDVTHWDCGRGWREGVVPIGRPIANVAVYVLNGRLEPAPEGVVGELYIGGEAVGRGYLRRPALTAERYVPDPHGGAAGGRLYRTGDLGRVMAGGVIEYVGRGDAQVKVRGMRVELGEVEAALCGHASVREAAAVAAGSGGQTRLVAFVVREGEREQAGEGDGKGLGAAVRRWLRERAPEYLVPAQVVELAAMPVTANGKLDRRALAALAAEGGEAGGGGVRGEWGSEAQRELAALWREALGVAEVGPHDNFFDLGGDSLSATRLIAIINDALQVELKVNAAFEYQTVTQMAELTEELRAKRAAQEQ